MPLAAALDLYLATCVRLSCASPTATGGFGPCRDFAAERSAVACGHRRETVESLARAVLDAHAGDFPGPVQAGDCRRLKDVSADQPVVYPGDRFPPPDGTAAAPLIACLLARPGW